MSAVETPPPPPYVYLVANSSPYSLTPTQTNLTPIGLGYAIAIALGFLVLFSTVLLASYICCRSAVSRSRRHTENRESGDNSIYLPRVIFVAEEDEDDDIEARNVVVGLDQAVINSYPKLVFSKRNAKLGNETICSICLCEYKESEALRMLPDCRHFFHVMCVDAWLKLNASCPVCRNSPLPTPVSTPLQEVVPLSQYADGRRRR